MTIGPVPASFSDLDEPHLCDVLHGIWRLLECAVGEGRHGFHLPCVASVRADGAPALRTVVLRAVERERRLLRFHTDARSPKLAELEAEPRVALSFYDPAEQTQLRVDALAEVHRRGAEHEAAWAGTGLFGRRCYLQEAAPGARLPGPGSALPPGLEGRRPTPEESSAGLGNFALVDCRVQAIDWFYLSAEGNRRARFAWGEGDRLEADWLAP